MEGGWAGSVISSPHPWRSHLRRAGGLDLPGPSHRVDCPPACRPAQTLHAREAPLLTPQPQPPRLTQGPLGRGQGRGRPLRPRTHPEAWHVQGPRLQARSDVRAGGRPSQGVSASAVPSPPAPQAAECVWTAAWPPLGTDVSSPLNTARGPRTATPKPVRGRPRREARVVVLPAGTRTKLESTWGDREPESEERSAQGSPHPESGA